MHRLIAVSAGNKSLIKLLSTLYEAGADHMNENVESLMQLLNDKPDSPATNLSAEEKEIMFEILTKMCSRKPKV